LQISSADSNSQPLCKAGICSQSLNPITNTHTTNVDPTSFKDTQTFANNKVLNLNHRFVSNKVDIEPYSKKKIDIRYRCKLPAMIMTSFRTP